MAIRIPGEGVSDRFRARMERAQREQEAQEQRIHDAINARLEHMRLEDETQRWQEQMSFEMYLTAGQIYDRFLDARNRNAPAPGESWSDAFCMAIEGCQDARMFLEETSIGCMEGRR